MQALEQSESVLNDEALFGQITSDRHLSRAMDILGVEDNDEDEDNGVGTVTFANADNDDDEDDEENDVLSFGRRFIWHWDKRKNKIEHEYAIAGWALCVMPEVRKDVAARLTGTHRDAVAEVVRRLHLTPCPNTHPDIARMTPADILDTLWNEFKSFQQCTHPFVKPSRWATVDVTQGNSFLW